MRGRFSGWGNDDLVVLAGGQYVTVAHPTESNGAVRRAIPTVTVDSQNGLAVAAIAARISADARVGVVTMGSTAHPLSITAPSAGRSMLVSTTSDYPANSANMAVCEQTQAPSGTVQCSLRAAVGVANADYDTNRVGTSTIDRITLPNGTYTISTLNGAATDEYGSVNYHLDIDAAVNIVGSSQTGTIISAGTTGYAGAGAGNGIDSLIEQNSQVVNSPQAFDMFLSNLTLLNGKNPNVQSSSNGYLANFYGGALDFDVYGAGVLTMSNVTFQGNSIVDGAGGAISVFNTNNPGDNANEGSVDFENSIVTYNLSPFAGGGLIDSDHIPVTVNNSIFSYNSATKGSSTQSDLEGLDNVGGGGIYLEPTSNLLDLTVTNSTFNNNTTDGQGGAIHYFSGSTMTNSTFTANNGAAFGGAIMGDPNGAPLNATGLTFTGNSINATKTRLATGVSAGAPNGGAVCMSPSETNYPGTVNLSYSRFHGNTADGGPYTGFYDGCGVTSGETATTVTLTNNWWGCNGAAAGPGGDTAGAETPVAAGAAGETLTLSPYTLLTLTLSANGGPYPVDTGMTTVAVTASLGQNSSDTTYTSAQDFAFVATPISAFSITNIGSVTYSPSATAFAANAVYQGVASAAVATASGYAQTSGTGTATVTVDGQTVTKTYSVTAADLAVTSSHTGNFRAGDGVVAGTASDTYTLTVANIGNGSTNGNTVTVTDTLPGGFTAQSLTGSGWSCSISSVSCTRSDTLAASVTYAAITLTVSVPSADIGSYTNNASVSGGGESNTNNDTGTDATIVIAPPTLAESFSPNPVAPNANASITFTVANPASTSAPLC